MIKTQTDYCGNMIYENGKLARMLIDGGYITLTGNAPVYHYYLQDHLGNNRVVVQAGGTVEQVNHYYPFGGLFGESTGGGTQPYKYNGKELDRMHGLDWYDYGARHYDAALGRWMCMDPLAEKYYDVTPYGYCGENPHNRIDIDGQWSWDIHGNLVSDNEDNEKTLADFLDTSIYNAGLLLFTYRILSNNKDTNMAKGTVLNKSNLWIMESDTNGDVVNNTRDAVSHYYYGNGIPADVGDEAMDEVLDSEIFKKNLNVITTQERTSNSFSVDLTKKIFHIGRTPVKYNVHPGKKASHVTFTLFEGDSFKDPLDIGIEVGGIPYSYKTRKITYFFKPVK
uniref:RHS repeat-associated core domain-containing protein n=1 Tax=Prevotella sp. GTC17262 TaxID=3236797 RepID=A0AB33JH39_9BACT